MNTARLSNLQSFHRGEVARHNRAVRLLEQLGERLSDTAEFNPSYYFQAVVDNREDLTALLTLAPLWRKSPTDTGISYDAQFEGERFQIIAKSAALPQTCKMVEEDYLIPAVEAKPASVGKRMVLKCDQPEKLAVPVVAALPETVHAYPEDDPFPGEPL